MERWADKTLPLDYHQRSSWMSVVVTTSPAAICTTTPRCGLRRGRLPKPTAPCNESFQVSQMVSINGQLRKDKNQP